MYVQGFGLKNIVVDLRRLSTPGSPMGEKEMTKALIVALSAVENMDENRLQQIAKYVQEHPEINLQEIQWTFDEAGKVNPIRMVSKGIQ